MIKDLILRLEKYKPYEESFENKSEAFKWVGEQVEKECDDNYRFAFLDDSESLTAYYNKYEEGCCGFFDRLVLVKDDTGKIRKALVGCNYGH